MAIVLMTVEETGRALGISRATVWRRIRRGELPTVRRGGRRLIPASALKAHGRRGGQSSMPPLTDDHPIFRLVGAGHGGGRAPGARDKHAILDR